MARQEARLFTGVVPAAIIPPQCFPEDRSGVAPDETGPRVRRSETRHEEPETRRRRKKWATKRGDEWQASPYGAAGHRQSHMRT
jgi:hypothetical protein